ncbi:MAG: LysR family transcriptional regulator [Polaromonas sp.]|jgi:DNA-binding transcriptional LysR family regulator|uniref:LysR family transcriptional regulator n=1 Tax=Polaromonas sp. TaxID=1869339 RepID=UPI00248922FB|nr:LysR family transcriptional regulator [Polaromonas sp.]MDI1236572.1 LysR family transcriptional regulator [Polaromonas sp.]MDO8774566.1 LysR family transcriptional regulator [Burkholderiaceae bacterium]MDP2379364.1 LysR family transcriptional regulator [Pseudohongiella sp.]
MELRQLRHFITLAETLNFSRAAIRLNIAQPALSISIRNLEEEIGARLFDRGSRRVSLTQAGRLTLSSARHSLAHAQDVSRLAGAAATGDAGIVKMTFVGGATFRLLPQRLPEFRRRFPEVEMELTEGTSTQVVERVRTGVVDVGIVRHPVIHPTGLATHVLETEQLVAVVPRTHRLAAKGTIRLRELTSEAFIQYSQLHAPSMHAVVSIACQGAGFMPLVSQEAIQIHTIISLVESGWGVALVPGSCEPTLGRNVTFLRIRDHKEPLKVGLALVTDPLNGTPLVQNLIRILSGQG